MFSAVILSQEITSPAQDMYPVRAESGPDQHVLDQNIHPKGSEF